MKLCLRSLKCARFFLVGFGSDPFHTSIKQEYVSRLEITDILRHAIDQHKERDSVGV